MVHDVQNFASGPHTPVQTVDNRHPPSESAGGACAQHVRMIGRGRLRFDGVVCDCRQAARCAVRADGSQRTRRGVGG